MEQERKKRRGWKIALTILCTILILLLVAVAFVAAYANHLMNLMGRQNEDNIVIISPEEAVTMTEETETVEEGYTGVIMDATDVTIHVVENVPSDVQAASSNIVNIMLIGQDRRAGQGRQRSDTMILATFNKEDKTVTLTSFLRDLYVQIPGYKDNRLNVPYVYGGMPLLKEAMYVNFGVRVDACIEVDFSGFIDVIDLLGGVDIELTQAEATYMVDGCKFDVKPGLNHLNGEQALAYARLREIDNDFGRTQRQRNVLTAVFNKCYSMSLSEMNDLLTKALPMITTDMTNAEMISYMAELLPVVAAGNLTTLRIPAAGMYQYAMISGKSVLLADMEATRELLYSMMLGEG